MNYQTEAVIASAARTAIGKAYRGSLTAPHGATLGAHAVSAAVERSGLEGAEIDDVIVGGSLTDGTMGANISPARSCSGPASRWGPPA
jgi:acetyl-CoA C-acetyltransferase